MKIKIKTKGKKFFFMIPTSWVFSGIGLLLLKMFDKSEDFRGLTFRGMRSIRKTIRRFRKKDKNWNLMELDSPEEISVTIKL